MPYLKCDCLKMDNDIIITFSFHFVDSDVVELKHHPPNALQIRKIMQHSTSENNTH